MIKATESDPKLAPAWLNLANGYFHLGKIKEAESPCRKAIELNPNLFNSHFLLSTILIGQKKLQEAEQPLRKTIELKPDYFHAYCALGGLLGELGSLYEAEISTRKAIELNPDLAEAHTNLGSILRNLGNLHEAKLSYCKAIELNPQHSNAHLNLGILYKDLGNLQEAEISTRKAIELNRNNANAYSSLGGILIDLGELQEAEISTRKAIELNCNNANAYSNLGIILKNIDKLPEAELSILKAIEINPNRFSYFHYASCLFEKGSLDEAKLNLDKAKSFNEDGIENFLLSAAVGGINYAQKQSTYKSKSDYEAYSKKLERIILNRPVESELLSYLYTLKNNQLEITKDARYGEGLCSTDFKLFEDNSKIISSLANDIQAICKKELQKKEIIFCDSFFNIFVSGSGAKKHNHIKPQDKNFNLHLHKYSLVYYLNIGDQKGEDPGILKLHEPEEEILPTDGMIVIIDGKKNHSVSYRGNKDRVMIGVNFYCF